MPTAAEREAFMKMMGISAADIVEPEQKPGPSSASAARAHLAKPHYPSVAESTSSSVGLSMSSVGSSVAAQRQSADKRRAFLAELGIPDSSLEEPRSGTSTVTSTPALSNTSHSGASRRFSGSEPGSATILSGGAARRYVSGASSSSSHQTSTEELKTAGNTAFEQGQFAKAIRFYTLAIDAVQTESASPQGNTMDSFLNGGRASATEGSTAVQLAALYSNRSAAYLQGAKQCESVESAYEHALYDAEQAVALRDNWFKGYSRQGDVFFKMQRYEQAADAFQMALHLEPGNSNIANSLDESRERARLQHRRARARRAPGHGGDVSDEDAVPLGNTAPTVPTSALFTSQTASEVNTPRGTGATPNSARMAYGLYDHGLPKPSARAQPPRPSPSQPNDQSPVAATYTGDGQAGRNAAARRNSFDAYYGTNHGDVREEWNRLKQEVQETTHDPTGDDYRQRELEKYRMQRSTGQRNDARSFASLRATYHSNPLVSASPSQAHSEADERDGSGSSSPNGGDAATRRTPYFASNGRVASTTTSARRASVESDCEKHLSTIEIPSQFSSEAASTYQQKLLEEYRRRKEKK